MVFLFSLLLMAGIILGQSLPLVGLREVISFLTSACLSYIMIEVGLEFSAEKRKVSTYGKDFVFAATAAILPAVLCFGYFIFFMQSQWKPALLSGLSTAPTSAGVLFTMLMAAGLSATWVFKKARVLAVLDDLVTILLLTPVQIIIHGFQWNSIILLMVIGLCLFAAFRFRNELNWKVGEHRLFLYGLILTGVVFLIKNTVHIHLEVLVPAFMLGCLIKLPIQREASQKQKAISLDVLIKALFMFLVGFSLPKIATGSISITTTIGHVLVLTFLANLGKFFLVFCYSKEASWRERVALGVAMFPRGEVGAAVLLIGISYGLSGYENALAVLSLALNLVLTGFFIWIVMRCLSVNKAS